MASRLRVLIVEDSPADAELVVAELQRGGYDVVTSRVQTADAMRDQLQRESWDLVISDFSMPNFSAPNALKILQQTVLKHPPFIIVSGTVGEDTAVAALKAGASDFMSKNNLSRFLPAVERELRDATLRREREALEVQLHHAQQLEVIGRLAGGIAHDFNNILSAILGYSEMVLEQIGPDKPISHDLQEISDAANRGAALTRQLLALSRKQTMRMGPIDLSEIVAALRDMLLRLIREDIDLRVALAEAVPPIIGDRSQLEQVVMNLVTNARDAMPHGGVLTISTAMSNDAPDQMTLTVSDTGSGIDEATKAHIFEPFFTTKDVGKGTGLGLATVYGIVKQLGGEIAIDSEIGQGTTFRLSFPVAVGDTPAPLAAVHARVAHVPEARYVILVVDDEQSVRKILCRILLRHGYEVLEADGPLTAAEIARTYGGPLHLVVSDVVMPDLYGPEMVKALRVQRPELPVVYVSGYADHVTSPRAAIDGADTLLEKPFSASELLETVRQALAAPTLK